jgi:hypothetical protein
VKVLLSDDRLLESPREINGVTTVVIQDNHGNPIFVGIQQDDDNIIAIDASDPKFDMVVSNLPISKRKTVVERL